jgi:hypothetical protein
MSQLQEITEALDLASSKDQAHVGCLQTVEEILSNIMEFYEDGDPSDEEVSIIGTLSQEAHDRVRDHLNTYNEVA